MFFVHRGRKHCLSNRWLKAPDDFSHVYAFTYRRLSVADDITLLTSSDHARVHTRTHTYAYIAHETAICLNPYPTAFPYGNGMVLHFYQQQESSTTTVHKVINKGLKAYV